MYLHCKRFSLCSMISENYTLWVVLFVFLSNLGRFRHEGIDDVRPIEGDSLKSRVKSKKLSDILFLFFDMFLVILLGYCKLPVNWLAGFLPSTVAQLNPFFFSKVATGHHLEDGRLPGKGRGGVNFAPFHFPKPFKVKVSDFQISRVFFLMILDISCDQKALNILCLRMFHTYLITDIYIYIYICT